MKRRISFLLALCLAAAMLPLHASAATMDWATDAVTTLNGIYTGAGFTDTDDTMTEGDASTILTAMGCETDVVASGSATELTRGKACEALAAVFRLPVATGQTAIEYLYEQRIVNGKSEDDLAENDPVTKAQFSVLAYRVLKATGGAQGSASALKPGTEGYFAWAYLSARNCFSSTANDATVNGSIGSTNVAVIVPAVVDGNQVWQTNHTEEKSGQDLWDAWALRLNCLKSADPNAVIGTAGTTVGTAAYSAGDTVIEAAIKIVTAYIADGGAETIFSDVPADHWAYDGLMYLFDHGVVSGTGSGTFDPTGEFYRWQLASILTRIDSSLASLDVSGVDLHLGTIPDTDTLDESLRMSAAIFSSRDNLGNYPMQTYAKAAQEKGYMNPPAENAFTWWIGKATREDLIVAILKMKAETAASKANTEILDRFEDAGDISDTAKTYMAYAVSCGLVSGTSATTLSPDRECIRAEMGVLLYRALVGLDTSKMNDYAENVAYAKEG